MSNKDEQIGRAAQTNALGETLTEQFNAAEAQAFRCEGGSKWLTAASQSIVKSLHAHVAKDLEEGKLPTEPAAVATFVNAYITRAGEGMLNLAAKAQTDSSVAHGRKAGLADALSVIKNHHKINLAGIMQSEAAQTAKDKILSGSPDAGETPQEQDFLAKLRAAKDPLDVGGTGNGGRQTRDERKLASLELKRRETAQAEDKPATKKPVKKRVSKRKAKSPMKTALTPVS